MTLIPGRGKRGETSDGGFWPGAVISNLRSEMDRLFERFMQAPWGSVESAVGSLTAWMPSVDVSEGESEITVRAEVPGVAPEDLDISISGQVLTIRGEKKEVEEREGENYFRTERRFGSFHRNVQLPAEIDAEKVSAEHRNGVLLIRLSKKECAVARKIPVNTSKD